jgi:hypothetical protein
MDWDYGGGVPMMGGMDEDQFCVNDMEEEDPLDGDPGGGDGEREGDGRNKGEGGEDSDDDGEEDGGAEDVSDVGDGKVSGEGALAEEGSGDERGKESGSEEGDGDDNGDDDDDADEHEVHLRSGHDGYMLPADYSTLGEYGQDVQSPLLWAGQGGAIAPAANKVDNAGEGPEKRKRKEEAGWVRSTRDVPLEEHEHWQKDTIAWVNRVFLQAAVPQSLKVVARRAGVPLEIFEEWYSGAPDPRVTSQLRRQPPASLLPSLQSGSPVVRVRRSSQVPRQSAAHPH